VPSAERAGPPKRPKQPRARYMKSDLGKVVKMRLEVLGIRDSSIHIEVIRGNFPDQSKPPAIVHALGGGYVTHEESAMSMRTFGGCASIRQETRLLILYNGPFQLPRREISS
jgi:hypothetical protein